MEDKRKAILRKVDFRILPFISLLYLFNFLDRVNIGNVHEQFVEDLGLTETQYSFGIGIFFLGYVAFELPSNLMLKKATPSKWIARIMFSWGVISTCMMFVKTYHGYLICRFFLGISEAGFFPGIIYYLTFWYRKEEQALRQSIFFSSAAIAGGIAGLLAHFLLQLDGLKGWQWVFLVEGVPSIILGIVTAFVLPDFPETCSFLTDDEKQIFTEGYEQSLEDSHFSKKDFLQTVKDTRVWLFCLLYFAVASCCYGIVFFLPALVQTFSTPLYANLMTVPIYLIATISTILFAYFSDKKRERPNFLLVTSLIAMVGILCLTIFPLYGYYTLAYISCFVAVSGVFPGIVINLAWITNYLNGSTSSATGTAMSVSIGNLGAFLVPQVFGWSKDYYDNYAFALGLLCSLEGATVILNFALRRALKKKQTEHIELKEENESFVQADLASTPKE